MNQYITGAVIKELREKYHLTQAELAEKLNVSDKTVSKWETAKGYHSSVECAFLTELYQYNYDCSVAILTILPENAIPSLSILVTPISIISES